MGLRYFALEQYESYFTLLFIFRYFNYRPVDDGVLQTVCIVPNGLMIGLLNHLCNAFIVAWMKHIVL